MKYALILFLFLNGCGAGKKTTGRILDSINLPFGERVDEFFRNMEGTGGVLSIGGIAVADIRQTAPIVSAYGTVTQGTTLNKLSKDGMDFLVYGEDGVFAAECETSGPTDPLCQTFGAETFNRTIVCFANFEGADIMTAQAWPGVAGAFATGRGLICYVDGQKMRSSHIFTY